MDYQVTVTNEELYNAKVVDVELDFHKGGLNGDVQIEVEGEDFPRVISGHHGTHDYEEEFGFIIEAIQYIIFDKSDNSSKPYISLSHNNCGDIESAMTFDSKLEAEEYIEDNEWGSWASVFEK